MFMGSFKCGNIIFDIFNDERVPKGMSDNKYFITPNRLLKIEAWVKERNIMTKLTPEDVEFFIIKNYIGTYSN